jgi:DNA-binding NtrC family response regulator
MASVLVLEDDGDMRTLMCELFSMAGADRCVAVGSVEELRKHAEALRGLELALIDINLGPGHPSGLAAYEWLLSQRFGGRVVFITGHATAHPLLREAQALRGVEVLRKPVDADILLDLLPAGEEAQHAP